MAEKYWLPGQVMSPKRLWTLVAVIYDEGEGEAAAAIGRWAEEPVLVMRWNGTDDNPIGNPQSRGLPTWFVVPATFRESVLQTILKLSPEKKALVQDFFSKK
jgi:hypothetical protein